MLCFKEIKFIADLLVRLNDIAMITVIFLYTVMMHFKQNVYIESTEGRLRVLSASKFPLTVPPPILPTKGQNPWPAAG